MELTRSERGNLVLTCEIVWFNPRSKDTSAPTSPTQVSDNRDTIGIETVHHH